MSTCKFGQREIYIYIHIKKKDKNYVKVTKFANFIRIEIYLKYEYIYDVIIIIVMKVSQVVAMERKETEFKPILICKMTFRSVVIREASTFVASRRTDLSS